MAKNSTLKPGQECDVCGATHDEEIHEATLSIHRWFQQEVTKYLRDPEDPTVSQVA